MTDDVSSGRQRASETLEERFFAKVNKNGPVIREELGPCWIWTAARMTNGYGSFWFSDHSELAHRVAWTFAFGAIPDGIHTLHRCDNRQCVNPGHLFLGTNDDNIADRVAKGRSRRGEEHPHSRLTADQVLEILGRAENGVALAREYGVSHTVIYKIRNGRSWKHLQPANDNGGER